MHQANTITQLDEVNDLRIHSQQVLSPPIEIKRKYPITAQNQRFISNSRKTINNILKGKDKRLIIVVGPCSIHDAKAAIEYAYRLRKLADKVSDSLFLVMRGYFEKPRTSIGWKGFINDPDLNGSFKVGDGLLRARKLLIELVNIGIPVATEALDPITPQFIHDLISWTAIGARTAESQTHREMASGLSSPVGFKNSTDGSLDTPINAIKSSYQPHSFLGIDKNGNVSITQTNGNPDTHIILRGGNGKPNYTASFVRQSEHLLLKHGISPKIMIDCSHVNSGNDHEKQLVVIEDITRQILSGNVSIKALMIESNIYSGNQILDTKNTLRYGVSITDRCIGWKTTEKCLKKLSNDLKFVLPRR